MLNITLAECTELCDWETPDNETIMIAGKGSEQYTANFDVLNCWLDKIYLLSDH